MRSYFRRVLKHDITHQISITNEIMTVFFCVHKEKESRFMVGRKSGESGMVTFLLSTDPRFGGAIKRIINSEGGIQENDILQFKKMKDKYEISVIDQSSIIYYKLISEFGDDRHLVFDDEANEYIEMSKSFVGSQDVKKNVSISTNTNNTEIKCRFSLNQTVEHVKFGKGIIKNIRENITARNTIYIYTIEFGEYGKKDISSAFDHLLR